MVVLCHRYQLWIWGLFCHQAIASTSYFSSCWLRAPNTLITFGVNKIWTPQDIWVPLIDLPAVEVTFLTYNHSLLSRFAFEATESSVKLWDLKKQPLVNSYFSVCPWLNISFGLRCKGSRVFHTLHPHLQNIFHLRANLCSKGQLRFSVTLNHHNPQHSTTNIQLIALSWALSASSPW